jgi:hypothetical protein
VTRRLSLVGFVGIVATGATTACSDGAGRARAGLDSVGGPDHVAIASVRAIMAAEEKLNALWPGSWPRGEPLAVFPFRGGTLLASTSSDSSWPDERWRPLTEIAGGGGRLFRADTVPPSGIPFVVEWPIAGRPTTAVHIPDPALFWRDGRPIVPWMSDSAAVLVMFLVHEHFHAFQGRSFRVMRGTMDVFADVEPVRRDTAVLRAPGVAESMAQERATLREALMATTDARRRAALRRYYELRGSRYARLPTAFATYEAIHERAEGVASAIGYDAVAAVYPATRSDADSLTAALLVAPNDAVRSQTAVPWLAYSNWHLYATGTAKVRLLSILARDWRTAVQNGASLDDVLLSIVR